MFHLNNSPCGSRARTQRDVQLSNEETAAPGCERRCFFLFLPAGSERQIGKKKKKKVSLPAPLSSQPRRSGSLLSSLFLAPLGCVSGLFFSPFRPCQQKLRRPHSPGGPFVVVGTIGSKCLRGRAGGGCHRSQGSRLPG